MPRLADFSAVIFDMDGLVLDTESTYCQAWQMAGQALGYALTDNFCRALTGLSGTAIEQKLFERWGANFHLPVFKQLSSHLWHKQIKRHGIAIKPGVIEWLNYLNQHAIPYALATNSRRVNVQLCLAVAGLSEAFAIQLTRDEVTEGKPSPAIFRATAERLQKDIRQCLVLEDSPAGVLSAHRAGAYVAYIPSVWPADAQSIRLSHITAHTLHSLFLQLQG